MDIRGLQLIDAIRAHGSVTAAARELGLAQSNASRLLARIEKDLDLTLVERTPLGSTLTARGDLVATWAQSVLAAWRHFTLGIQSLADDTPGALRVAASLTVAENLAPRWIAAYREREPHVVASLSVANSADVIEQVSAGTAHLGFIESPIEVVGLEQRVVYHDRLSLVVAPEHPWARRRKAVTAALLAREPLVVRERGSGTRLTLERELDRVPGHPRATVALECASNAAVIESVRAGVAPAVISELAVSRYVRDGALVHIPLRGVDLRRLIRAVWRPNLGTAGRDFIATLSAAGRRV